MRLSSLLVGVALGSVGGIALVRSVQRPTDFERFESARLQAHFDSVDTELRQGDVSAQSVTKRQSRARLIEWLRDYRHAGAFPRNDRFGAGAVPFFRDSQGALCAMAYLIARSGRVDLVERIVQTRNNAFIAELAADPALRRWLDSVGLSTNEAARIQPTYGTPRRAPWISYHGVAIATTGAAVVTAGVNVLAPSVVSGLLGVASGLTATFVSWAHASNTGETTALVDANFVAGFAAVVLGVRGLIVAGHSPRHQESREPGSRRKLEIGIMPTLGTERGFGLALDARF